MNVDTPQALLAGPATIALPCVVAFELLGRLAAPRDLHECGGGVLCPLWADVVLPAVQLLENARRPRLQLAARG